MGPILALLTAILHSFTNILNKKSLQNINEYIVAWSVKFFALIILIPLLFYIDIPTLNSQFWLALVIVGPLNLTATVLYMKAIKHSDLSITIPMLAFTPLFLLVTSPLIINEFPSIGGLIGIIIIVIGSYILNIKQKKNGYFAPFKALLKEKGPRFMLIIAFIRSISANFDKIGIQNSSAFFRVIAVNIFIIIFLFPIMIYKSKNNLKQIKQNYKRLIPIGILGALAIIFHMTAINYTLVAYVIAIKRTSIVFTIILSYFIFNEKNIKERLIGSVIMVLGIILITFFH